MPTLMMAASLQVLRHSMNSWLERLARLQKTARLPHETRGAYRSLLSAVPLKKSQTALLKGISVHCHNVYMAETGLFWIALHY